MSKAIYPGSFDPVTNGHLDVIKRSAAMFDEVIVGVLNNSNKHPLFSAEERVEMLQEAVRDYANVSVISFEGLLVNYMRQNDISVIIRGLRAVTDYNRYSLQTQEPLVLIVVFTHKIINFGISCAKLLQRCVKDLCCFLCLFFLSLLNLLPPADQHGNNHNYSNRNDQRL